jgi:hypothetical protein
MALYTFKFVNYAEAQAVAEAAGFWDYESNRLRTDGQSQAEDGGWFGWNIDEIGQDPVVVPAVLDEEGNVLTPAVQETGYFVNATGQMPPAVAPYLADYYGQGGRFYAGAQEYLLHEGEHADGTYLGETYEYGGKTWEWTPKGWRVA